MHHLIEYCTKNTQHGTDDVIRRLEERPDVDAIEYGCLGYCGQCYMEPYVLVDGVMVAAETAEQLYELVLRKLDEEEEDPFADLPLD